MQTHGLKNNPIVEAAVQPHSAQPTPLQLTTAVNNSVLPVAERFNRCQAGKSPSVTHIPTGNTVDLPALRAYAIDYARTQQEFNGAFPAEALVKDPKFKDRLTGDVPYWDIDPAQVSEDGKDGKPRARFVGLAAGSPLITPDGKLRLFTHYLNETAKKELEKEFGPPQGHVMGMMTSAFRTLVICPDDGVPYMLKFSGDEATPWGASKQLQDVQVLNSVERSLRYRDTDFLIPEPSGLLVGGSGNLGKALNVLYRPLVLPTSEGLHNGDRLFTWHVLMSPEFRDSPQATRMFRDYGGMDGWFEKEAAPAMAEDLFDSIVKLSAHLELHSQNVDVLVAASGHVHRAYAKDLADVMNDPALYAATGRRPKGVPFLRDETWGDASDASNPKSHFSDVGAFYSAYFSQLGVDRVRASTNSRYAGLTTDTKFRAWTMDALHELVEQRLDVKSLARFPEYEKFSSQAERKRSPYNALNGLRNAYIKDELTKGFVSNPAAQVHFQEDGIINSSSKAAAIAFSDRIPDLSYGYVGRVPVAVVHDSDTGLVKEFYFKFPEQRPGD